MCVFDAGLHAWFLKIDTAYFYYQIKNCNYYYKLCSIMLFTLLKKSDKQFKCDNNKKLRHL